MKKIIRNVLLGIVTFLSFLGYIKAIELNLDSVVYIGEGYKSISCPNNLKYFNVSKQGDIYAISLKNDLTDIQSSVSEELTCEYMKSSSSSKIENVKASVKYTLTYNANDIENTYRFTLTKTNFNSTPGRDFGNEFPTLKSVIGFEVISGSEFVEYSCVSGSDSCVVQLKSDFYGDTDKVFTATLKYKDIYGATVTTHLIGTLRGKGTFELYPGTYGKCNFGSEWTLDGNKYVMDYNGGNIVLPTCSSENSSDKAIEFYGWADTSNVTTTSNICKEFAKYKGGETFNPDETGINKLFSCYVTKGGIIVQTNGAVVEPGSNWIALGKDEYFILGEDKIMLPNVISVPKIYGENAKFLGWQLNGTKDLLQASTYVDANRNVYSAIFETNSGYGTAEEYDFNYMYEGDTQVYALSGVNFDSCVSNDPSFVKAEFTNNKCNVTALKSTNDNIVYVYAYASGKQYTLKLKIVPKGTSTHSSSSSTEEYYEPYVISFNYLVAGDKHMDSTSETPNEIKDKEDKEPGESIAETKANEITLTTKDAFCDSFYVNKTTPLADGENRVIATSTLSNALGFKMGMPKFIAKSNCNDNKNYDTICLDPSGTAPKSGDAGSTADGILYYKTDFPTAEFEKAASIITGELVKKKYQSNQDELLAANMALRIISYDMGLSNVFNQEKYAYAANHLLYSGFAKAMRKEINEAKDITLNNSKYGYPATWNEENIRKLVVKYLKLYYFDNGATKNTSKKDFEFKLIDGNFVEEAEGVGTFSGKLEVPSGIVNLKPAIVATKAFKNGLISYEDVKFDNDGNFSFKVKYSDAKVISESGVIKFKIIFTTDSGRLKVALLKPDEKFKASHYQRMIIFDDDNDDSAVYFEFTAKGGHGSKPEEDEDEDETGICEISVEKLLADQSLYQQFIEKDCCQYVTDQNSELFQKICYQYVNCVKNTFALACDPNTYNKKDIYSVNEGYVKVGNDYVEKYDTCILDVKKGEQARKNTDEITDAVGNKISLDLFADNKYCRVSCKEDWDFSFYAFNNFTGEHAIKAGSYFEVDDGIFIGGTRTCVTTYIDVDSYVNEVDSLSSNMVNSYNDYALYSTVRNVLAESATVTLFGTYYDYDYDLSESSYACPTTGTADFTVGGIGYKVGDTSCGDKKIEVVKVKNKKQHNGVTVSVDSSSSNVKSSTRAYKQYGAKAGSYTFNPNPPYRYTNTCENINISNGSWYSKASIDNIKNNCFDQHETVEDIVSKYLYNGKPIGKTIDVSKSTVRSSKAELEKSAQDMASCQNFYLSNETKIENNTFNVGETELSRKKVYDTGYAYEVVDKNKTINNQSLAVDYLTVDTKFAPSARFQYEEYEFMSIIGEENYLVTFDDKNKEKGLTVDDNNKCIDIDLDDSKDKELKTALCKNKVDTYSYKSSGNVDVYSNSNAASSNVGNVSDAVKSKNFVLCQIGDGDYATDSSSGRTDCANAILYYYDVNYIKQSLKNSSYYKNYGTWYIQNGTDVKTYEPSLDEAMSRFGGNKYNWSILSAYNTFPIAMTTRKNIYRYMYSFDNIGYFANNNSRKMVETNKDAISDLGRIMGATNSIMINNIHSCFYEVFEDICKCCGDPIDTALLEAGSYGVITEEHLNDYCANNNCSKSNPTIKSAEASLNFYPSTVSLYDLKSIFETDNLSNWGTSNFVVSGNTYTTDKGAQLVNQIQSVGENVYDDTPEYSFYFETEALSKIKEYNRGTGYYLNIDNLIPYGYYKVVSDSVNDFEVEDSDSQVTLIHYGSKFLEDLVGYVPTDYLNKTFISRKNNNVCYVVSTDTDAASMAYKMSKEGNCRWVDYVQYDEGTSNYFRLAYK